MNSIVLNPFPRPSFEISYGEEATNEQGGVANAFAATTNALVCGNCAASGHTKERCWALSGGQEGQARGRWVAPPGKEPRQHLVDAARNARAARWNAKNAPALTSRVGLHEPEPAPDPIPMGFPFHPPTGQRLPVPVARIRVPPLPEHLRRRVQPADRHLPLVLALLVLNELVVALWLLLPPPPPPLPTDADADDGAGTSYAPRCGYPNGCTSSPRRTFRLSSVKRALPPPTPYASLTLTLPSASWPPPY
ncbi:hypothetical protein B0H14DRAFT_3504571 [Mycena olivaceomarginata]|nr:hypothetical protein B0H14DRAFT_3504571 [Mycena olivaceomarginata]